jgi:hypothetical protein
MQNSEQKIISAIEKVISLTNTGVTSNDAIQKVAEAEGFSPGSIETMVAAFNKSKTVQMLKTANSDDFDLADANIIINKIFKHTDTVEKVAMQFPKGDYSKVDLQEKVLLNKTASEDIKPTPKEALQSIDKYAQVHEATKRKLQDDVAKAQYDFNKAVESVLQTLAPMSTKELQKVANLVVSGYTEQGSGKKFMELCLNRLRKDEAIGLQKTASAVVFPVKEPYLSISKVFQYAQKLSTAKNSLVFFSKEAAPYTIAKDIGANVLTNALTAAVGNEPQTPDIIKQLLGSPKDEVVEELLDPEYYNKLKTLDAKRNLMELALYDKHLKKYDLPILVDAYNSVVELTPKAYKNKSLLKNLMLAHIESGGVRGLYELSTELGISDRLDARYRGEEEMDMAKRREISEERAAIRDRKKLELSEKQLKAQKAQDAAARADRKSELGYRKSSDKSKNKQTEDIEEKRRQQAGDLIDMKARADRLTNMTKLMQMQDPTNPNPALVPFKFDVAELSDEDRLALFNNLTPIPR